MAPWRTGVPLSYVLKLVGVRARAKYVVFFPFEEGFWDSLDMAGAWHPQTFLAYGMSGRNCPLRTERRFDCLSPSNSATRA